MKIRCIIVEDTEHFGKILTKFISQMDEVEIVGNCLNAEDAIQKIQYFKPELIFMDIQLGTTSGFKVLDYVEGYYKLIIFTTAYTEYAVKSFNYPTVHYLLKPYTQEMVENAIRKALLFLNYSSDIENYPLPQKPLFNLNFFFIPTNNKYFPVEVDKLIYIKAEGSYCTLFMKDQKKIRVSKPMKSILDNNLSHNASIIRIHKSYAVNVQFITQVKRGTESSLVLNGDIELPISNSEKDFLFSQLGIKHI